MTSKYIDLAERIWRTDNGRTSYASVGMVLEWLDDHPDQVPRPRMTYSELAEEVKSVERVEKRFEAVAYVLTNLGFTICSDPEPTNAEKLADFVRQLSRTVMSAEECGKWLDERGVKATGGDE